MERPAEPDGLQSLQAVRCRTLQLSGRAYQQRFVHAVSCWDLVSGSWRTTARCLHTLQQGSQSSSILFNEDRERRDLRREPYTCDDGGGNHNASKGSHDWKPHVRCEPLLFPTSSGISSLDGLELRLQQLIRSVTLTATTAVWTRI
mmetsp:Transcript_22075/g.52391  ORF Transcript_22075/g.52391 Transcript_22075/m.52391 type:complete len:146 (-) Transcript_22075:260-697(-)